jgi:CubicO group peptidase (beta-lactamase class C family)
VNGTCEPAFAAVRREFERNFTHRGEQGAACAVYYRGRKVVDLWGGSASASNARPWNEQTLVLSFSVTKGMAAAAMVVAHHQGLFELDRPVAEYWPEFAQAGKQRITVRQLFTHQAGLVTIDGPVQPELLADHDRLAALLAAQRPAWEPGTRHGYHTITLGWYQNELLRRVDPRRRSLGTFFQDEVARPLGVDFYIGLPADVPTDRIAEIKGFHRLALLAHVHELPIGMILAGIWPRSLVSRSVRNLPLSNPAHIGEPGYRELEIPSANGIGQATAVAAIYGELATGGTHWKLRDATRDALLEPARIPEQGERDTVLKLDSRYTFGFSRPSRHFRFGGSESAFGCPGAGGSFGMGDPEHGLGFAYLTRKMGFRLFDDVREKAVRDACYQSLAAMNKHSRAA